MYSGNNLWGKKYTSDMVPFQFGENHFDTYPDLPSNLYEALCSSASSFPEKKALEDDSGVSCTYHELLEKTDVFASYLLCCKGIKKGSQTALLLYNSIEFAVSFLALIKLGAVTVPLPTKFKKNEVLALLEKTEVTAIICDPKFMDWFQDIPSETYTFVFSDSYSPAYGLADYICVPDLPIPPAAGFTDPAIIMFTSGTTDQSKGVLLRNYNIMHAVESYRRILNVTSEDLSVIPVPMYHITGLIALLGLFIYTGGTLYLHKFFHADKVLEAVSEKKITFLHASPTVFSMLLGQADNYPSMPSLKTLVCGSANIPSEKLKHIHQWLPSASFHTVYGLTETASPASVFPGDACTSPHIGSCGLPIPGSDFKIISGGSQELPPDTVGEIFIRGTMVLSEYYRLSTPLLDEEGWLKTGDLGYFTSDGYLYVVDRKKDMINRGGEKIWSTDVENELYAIPGITEAAVVGIPDDIYGEIPAAVITVSKGCDLTDTIITDCLKPRIAKYKIPARILILEEIPLTANLKTDKRKIKELFIRLQKEEAK